MDIAISGSCVHDQQEFVLGEAHQDCVVDNPGLLVEQEAISATAHGKAAGIVTEKERQIICKTIPAQRQ